MAHEMPGLLRNQLVRFVLAGLPAFVLAVPLNWALVRLAGVPKSPAYAIVLSFQVIVNFFICYYFVFEKAGERSLLSQFWQFTAGILAFRAMDWAVYSLGTSLLGVPFLVMQLVDVVVFMLLKYLFARRVMGRGQPSA